MGGSLFGNPDTEPKKFSEEREENTDKNNKQRKRELNKKRKRIRETEE